MKYGFTLIELLAVIVILAVIALIATPIVLGIINDVKEQAVVRSAEFYVNAVENKIMQENMKLGGKLNPKECIVGTDGNVTCDGTPLEIEVNGDKPDSGSITFDRGRVTGITLTFGDKKVVTNANGELVLEDTEQEDNAQVCTLLDGEPNEIGSKYQCKVKDNMETGFEDGYYFYVLSHNDDGTTNLIMERNMYYDEENDVGKVATEENKGHVNWFSLDVPPGGSYIPNSSGPVMAMTYLHDATKDWHNIPNMKIDYNDATDSYGSGTYGYGGIKTIDNITIITNKNSEETSRIENLKTRLPKFDEINGDGKCKMEGANSIKGSCPLWMVNYLDTTTYYSAEDGKIDIVGVGGYWTLSTFTTNSYTAMLLSANGYLANWYVAQTGLSFGDISNGIITPESTHGVRPIITLEI